MINPLSFVLPETALLYAATASDPQLNWTTKHTGEIRDEYVLRHLAVNAAILDTVSGVCFACLPSGPLLLSYVLRGCCCTSYHGRASALRTFHPVQVDTNRFFLARLYVLDRCRWLA
jgi:hypothetical protein